MPLTQQDREWFEQRDSLDDAGREAVDFAFETAVTALHGYGIVAAMDDRAASFEAAIVRYVLESREAGSAS